MLLLGQIIKYGTAFWKVNGFKKDVKKTNVFFQTTCLLEREETQVVLYAQLDFSVMLFSFICFLFYFSEPLWSLLF